MNREYFLVLQHNRELLKQAELHRLARLAYGSRKSTLFMGLLRAVGQSLIRLGRGLVKRSEASRARESDRDAYIAVRPKQIQ